MIMMMINIICIEQKGPAKLMLLVVRRSMKRKLLRKYN